MLSLKDIKIGSILESDIRILILSKPEVSSYYDKHYYCKVMYLGKFEFGTIIYPYVLSENHDWKLVC